MTLKTSTITSTRSDPLVSLAQASNDFGLRLFAQLWRADRPENVFLSPFSIAAALTMTYNGARGATATAMAETLGVAGWGLEALDAAHAALNADLSALSDGVTLGIANSLWARQGVSFYPDFLSRCMGQFQAEARTISFQEPESLDIVNGWVAEKTLNKIQNLLKPGDLASAILALVNALYFKGLWQSPFDAAQTAPGLFTCADGVQKSVQLMQRNEQWAYSESDEFQAVGLPYRGERLAMYIILPRLGRGLENMLAALTLERWNKWMKSFHSVPGRVSLPRFRLEYECELKNVLSRLGMEIAFGEEADFSAMTGGRVMISKVRHKTFLEVNEEGAEAAAATAVVMVRGMPMSPFELVVDRPFLCAIVDRSSGAILFLGVVVDLGS